MKTIKGVLFDLGVTVAALTVGMLIAANSYGCESASSFAAKMEKNWSAVCVVMSDSSVRCVSTYDQWSDPKSTHPNEEDGGGYYAFLYECREGWWQTVGAWWAQ